MRSKDDDRRDSPHGRPIPRAFDMRVGPRPEPLPWYFYDQRFALPPEDEWGSPTEYNTPPPAGYDEMFWRQMAARDPLTVSLINALIGGQPMQLADTAGNDNAKGAFRGGVRTIDIPFLGVMPLGGGVQVPGTFPNRPFRPDQSGNQNEPAPAWWQSPFGSLFFGPQDRGPA